MRGIFGSAAANDPQMDRALGVLAAFDTLVGDEADHTTVTEQAAAICDRTVMVVDVWNDLTIRSSTAAAAEEDAPDDVDMVRDAPAGSPTVIGGRLALAVEIASGRIGVVWMEADGRGFDEVDHLVVERLAGTVAIAALRTHRNRVDVGAPDPHAIERLVSGSAGDDELAELLRHCGLDAAERYVALGVGSKGGAPSSPAAAARAVADVLTSADIDCRAVAIGPTGAVVARCRTSLPAALSRVPRSARVRALRVVVGVGAPHPAMELERSWRQAQRALALSLASSADGPRVSTFAELGARGLLPDLAADEVAGVSDVVALRELAVTPGGGTDIEVLRAYCETESLRGAADRVHLHHSSVGARIKRLERDLAVRLDDPMTRLRFLLALDLFALQDTPR